MVLGKRKLKRQSTSPAKQKKCFDDPQNWTVVELRNWLRENGEKVGGTKAVLIERVENFLATNGDSVKENNKKSTRSSSRNKKKLPTYDESESDESMDEEEEEEEEKVVSTRKSSRNIEKKEKEENPAYKWETFKRLIYCNPKDSNDSDKIAAFDMDSTLIVTSSGKTFAQGRNDWVWMFDCIPDKLKELHDDGYKVVIVSNQKGIGTGKISAATIQGKIEDLIKDCNVPICSILATQEDEYRKPAPNAWYFLRDKLVTKSINLDESFYIGDAAGRIEGWKPGKKKDFGCSDRKFAINAGITFKTPEEYFLNEKSVPFEWHGINPNDFEVNENIPYNAEDFIKNEQEVILFVGFPASGKSTFAKQYLVPNGYVHINRDTLGTMSKCEKAAREALSEGKKVVIDNTNPSEKARFNFIKIADKAGVSIRCFHFQTPLELAKHMNNFREVITNGETRHVPMVGYNMFKKHFQEPSVDEGFSEIKKIEFKRYHPDKTHKELFEQWTERIR